MASSSANPGPLSRLRARRHNIIQGGYAISEHPEMMLSTILGSCVAACIRDPIAKVGGMNHFLLPGDGGRLGAGSRFGAYLMEVLINDLLKHGARRDRLEAKLFGGARVVDGLSDIGAQNSDFARRFLADEGIRFAGGSLGGDHARRIEYWPVTGVARQRRMDVAPLTETRSVAPAVPVASGGDLELWG